MNDISKRIIEYNAENGPKLNQIKYELMAENAFRFFRGTCHIFGEDLSKLPFLFDSPTVWACGDLHIENFGSYRGDTGLVYFDVNDFDESILAPLYYDIARCVTSIFLAFGELNMTEKSAMKAAKTFLNMFSTTLAQGKARYIEPQTATGVVKKFLKSVDSKKRKDLIEERTRIKNGKLKLNKDLKKAFKIEKTLKRQLISTFQPWMKSNNEPPNDYHVLDVCFRIAGTGSIGVERYLFLIQKNDDPSKFMLIDQKEARPSCLTPFIKIPQPIFDSEAERIVSIQKRMQNIPPAQLSTLDFQGKSYVMQEMQPTRDRFNFELIENDTEKVCKVIEDMAMISASCYLSSRGRQGSSIGDELIEFGKRNDWPQKIIDYALYYIQKVKKDYYDFKEDMDNGTFKNFIHTEPETLQIQEAPA
jgi:uncharacterized protein (DUF2252 family)